MARSAHSRGGSRVIKNQRDAFVGDGNCYLSAVLQAWVIDPELGRDRRHQRVIKLAKNSFPGGKVC